MSVPIALDIRERVLMGPGPSAVSPAVLRALGMPTIGHLDPVFLSAMDETRAMLRQVFQTSNAMTLPISGTGSAGMETLMVNLVEPGDRVVVGQNGVFGGRMAEVLRRAGAEVMTVEGTWGRRLDPERMRAAVKSHGARLICVVHAETSTGVLEDLGPLRAIADEASALLVCDMVTSLGGTHVDVDGQRVDAAYAGTQKCLSCPPGLAPITLEPQAVARLEARQRPVQSWYLDLSLLRQYWGSERVYHHTAPVNMVFALHQALREVLSETLAVRVERHRRLSRALGAGLEALGLSLLVPEDERLPQLTTVQVPKAIDEAAVRKFLLERFDLEIGGGLGPLKGQVWRIGLMGHGATRNHVVLCLSALKSALAGQGVKGLPDPLPAVDAALS